nr:NAD-dependent epimerase/dehydratase family protein [Bacteroidota bacterium]
MKHCCIIGGNGFIGTHVVDTLLTLDRKITVIDKNPLPSKVLPKEVRYITGDYGVKNLLVKSLKDVNEVIHLAYSTIPKTSFENPIKDILDNLPATVGLLEV